MKKNALKFLVNTLLFINLSSVAVLGILLGFVIPRGKGGPSETSFLGLHRHEWGDIHLYLSLLFLLLLIVHIWFNWSWVVQSTRRYFADHWNIFLWIVSAAPIVLIFIGWIILNT